MEMTNFDVGLEVHVQLNTNSKLFSESKVDDSGMANSRVKYFDLGLPGMLPKLNEGVIEKSILLGKALNCSINEYSRFDRKHYYYPDLPLSFQITQFYYPICEHGYIELKSGKRIQIRRIHIETDAGKMIHEGGLSLIDYNRCGVPLLEVVTEPDIQNIEEATQFVKELILLLKAVNVCNCNMEHGNIRIDVNLSIRNHDGSLGVRSEIKNLNSLKFMCDAIEAEYKRQKNSVETLTQTTRGFNTIKKTTFLMRDKEDCFDYKYVPDFNIPPLHIDREYIDSITLPELPGHRRKKLSEYLHYESVDVLVNNIELYNFFQKACNNVNNRQLVANLLITDLVSLCKKAEIEVYNCNVTEEHLRDLTIEIENKKITSTTAKIILEEIFNNGKSVKEIIKEKGLSMISDINEIEKIIKQVISQNTNKWQKFTSGEDKLLKFFIGKCMQISGGKIHYDSIIDILFKIKNTVII